MDNCILTGLPIGESPIKKMCYNCVSFVEDNNFCTCNNPNVMKMGVSKIEEAAKQLGFDIDSLKLKPMALKKPSGKCPNYLPNMPLINNYINSIFEILENN